MVTAPSFHISLGVKGTLLLTHAWRWALCKSKGARAGRKKADHVTPKYASDIKNYFELTAIKKLQTQEKLSLVCLRTGNKILLLLDIDSYQPIEGTRGISKQTLLKEPLSLLEKIRVTWASLKHP